MIKEMTTYQRIYKHQNGSCFYCGEKIEFDDMEKEHVFPRSKGGRGIKNKVLSCHFCNKLKSNLIIDDFKIKVEELLNKNNNDKLLNILSTLNNIKEIRENWHKKSLYNSTDINKKPINRI